MLRANTARGVIVVALTVVPLAAAYGLGRGFRCWVKKVVREQVAEEVTEKVAQAQHEWVIRTTLAERLNDEEDKEE